MRSSAWRPPYPGRASGSLPARAPPSSGNASRRRRSRRRSGARSCGRRCRSAPASRWLGKDRTTFPCFRSAPQGGEALQLGGVEVVVMPRGAVLERSRNLRACARDVSQLQLGETQPEVELVVIRDSIEFLLKQGARRGVVAGLHGGEPALEEIKRRMAFDARELALDGRRLGLASQPAERKGQVGERAGIVGLAFAYPAEYPLGHGRLAAAQIDDAERVVRPHEPRILTHRLPCPP